MTSLEDPSMVRMHFEYACPEDKQLLEAGHLLRQMPHKYIFAYWLLSQSQPEFTGLQSHVLILVLGPLQHVL